jgi:hypothetical protein
MSSIFAGVVCLGESVEFGDADRDPAAVAGDGDLVCVQRGSGCDSAPTAKAVVKVCRNAECRVGVGVRFQILCIFNTCLSDAADVSTTWRR